MTFIIRKAERKQARLRIGVTSPSGGGKTYSALLLARGLSASWEEVGLIDTENKSGDLYSDLGPYNVITLGAPFTPERYIQAIKAFEQAGIKTIIIDSATHEWDGEGGCLRSNDLLAQTKFKGNTWAAWSDTTPRHQKFIDAIVSSPCNIITTTRSKTDTVQTEDKKIKKVGMKEIQRDGFEYELTINFNIDRETHYAIASKDRTGLFEGFDPFIITEETGRKILAWNNGGAVETNQPAETPDAPAPVKPPSSEEKVARIKYLMRQLGRQPANETPETWKEAIKQTTLLEPITTNMDQIIGILESTLGEDPFGGPAGGPGMATPNGVTTVITTPVKASPVPQNEAVAKPEPEKAPVAPAKPAEAKIEPMDYLAEAAAATDLEHAQLIVDTMVSDMKSPAVVAAVTAMLRSKGLAVVLPGDKSDASQPALSV